MSHVAKSIGALEVFMNAVDIVEDVQRNAYLDRVCGTQTELRQRVDDLLVAHEKGQQNILNAALVEEHVGQVDVAHIDTGETNLSNPEAMGVHETGDEPIRGLIDVSQHPMIGHYKLLEELGHGGMGSVYMAQQSQPVKRKVALKVIKPGMDTKEVIARFEAERQALAMMDHANIARVLDGGTTDEGRPYFVMELVRGVPITEYCKHKKLPLRQRLELFVDICKAVQHAHQKGIIHRDLKPSNIMITLRDGVPVVKVIDFGVAKALNQELTERTLYTQYSQMVGTPLYMAPEQAEMSCLDIDTRSDIYSLGVILYELLTETTPFDKATMSSLGVDGIRKLIKEQEPQRPSARVSTMKVASVPTIDDERTLDADDVAKQLKRELDWIVMKALEKDRERRYDSANAFAADVQRYLDDEPVEACPPTMAYRLKKYAKKHKAWLTTATLLVAMLLTSTAVSGVFAFQANEARVASEKSEQDAKEAQSNAETEKEKAVAAQKQSDENFAAALAAIDKLLEHASSEDLREIPGAQLTRLKILEDVLAFYSQFEVNGRQPFEIQFRAAQTWKSLAMLAREVGAYDQAEKAFKTGYELFKQLAGENQAESNYQTAFASITTEYGDFQINVRQNAIESERLFNEALSQLHDIAEHLPKSESKQTIEEGLFLAKLGLAQVAEKQELYSVRKTLLAELERNRQNFVSGDRLTLAKLDLQLAKNLRANKKDEQSDEQMRRLADSSRTNLDNLPTRAARALHVQVVLQACEYFKERDPKYSLELLCEALTVAEKLLFDFPGIPHYEKHVVSALTRFFPLMAEHDKSWVGEVLSKYRGTTYVENAAESIVHVTNLIEQFPDREVYYFLRARLLMEMGEISKASEDIFEGLKLSPNSYGVHQAYGWTLLRGEDRFQKLTSAIEEFPEIGSYYHFRAVGGGSNRTLEDINQDFEDALKYDKLSLSNWYRFDQARMEAGTHFREGRLQEALDAYDKAINLNPKATWLYKRRARVHFDLENFEEAFADLVRDYELGDGDASSVWWISVSEVAACPDKDFARKLREFADRVVEESNRSTDPLVVRLPLLVEFGETEQAKDDLKDIVERDEPNLDWSSLYYPGLLTAFFEMLPQYEMTCSKMVDRFQKSKKTTDAHFAAWTCALAPNALDDYEPAIKLARQAVEQDSDNQQYLDGLGAILMRAGKHDEAKEQLEKALEAGENDNTSPSYIHYFLAMTEHHVGNAAAAKEHLSNANESADKELAGSPAWNRKLTLELLRKEAEVLLNTEEVSTNKKADDESENN